MVSRFDLCRGDPMTVEKRKRDIVRKLHPSASTCLFKWGMMLPSEYSGGFTKPHP